MCSKKPTCKEHPSENQVTGIVCKVECRLCSLVYIGESKRSWNLEFSQGGIILNEPYSFYHVHAVFISDAPGFKC